MRRWLILVTVLAFAIAALAWMPASLLLDRVQAQVPAVRLEEPGGTIWHGRAGRVRVGAEDWGRLRWRVRPARLLRGEIAADVQLESPRHRFTGQVWRSFRRAGVRDASAELPAELLAPAFANTGLIPSGRWTLNLARATFEGRSPRAIQGEAVWPDAAVGGSARAALGTLYARFRMDDGAIHGELGDAGGPLVLAGTFGLDPGGYRVDARLSARDPGLEPALGYLGQPHPQGGRQLLMRGGWLSEWLGHPAREPH